VENPDTDEIMSYNLYYGLIDRLDLPEILDYLLKNGLNPQKALDTLITMEVNETQYDNEPNYHYIDTLINKGAKISIKRLFKYDKQKHVLTHAYFMISAIIDKYAPTGNLNLVELNKITDWIGIIPRSYDYVQPRVYVMSDFRRGFHTLQPGLKIPTTWQLYDFQIIKNESKYLQSLKPPQRILPDNYTQWQEICSYIHKTYRLDELKEIANEIGITGNTKDELCSQLTKSLTEFTTNKNITLTD
jgi:hypothetical protein